MTQPFEPLGHVTFPGDLRMLQKLVHQAANCSRTGYAQVVEVGSWVGSSAKAILETAEVDHLWCVDLFTKTGDITALMDRVADSAALLPTFCHNLKEYLHTKVSPLVGSSEFWAGTFPFQVDLVFIDADHSYESVKKDIACWLPRVLSTGIICGHDYESFPSVRRAVDESFPVNSVWHQGDVWWHLMPDHSS